MVTEAEKAWAAHLNAVGTSAHDYTLAIYRGARIAELEATLASRDSEVSQLRALLERVVSDCYDSGDAGASQGLLQIDEIRDFLAAALGEPPEEPPRQLPPAMDPVRDHMT